MFEINRQYLGDGFCVVIYQLPTPDPSNPKFMAVTLNREGAPVNVTIG